MDALLKSLRFALPSEFTVKSSVAGTSASGRTFEEIDRIEWENKISAMIFHGMDIYYW